MALAYNWPGVLEDLVKGESNFCIFIVKKGLTTVAARIIKSVTNFLVM